MGMKCKLFYFIIFVLLAIGLRKFLNLIQPLPPPKLDLNQFWGPGDVKDYEEDNSTILYKIFVDQEVIDKLKKRIDDLPLLHEPLENTNFEYGFNTNALKKVVKYWQEEYLQYWRGKEVKLNYLPQYRTQIQGLNIHYLHTMPNANPDNFKRIPILLLHGWPGSVREFYELGAKLAEFSDDKKGYVFDVVAPSLPGYGFSDGASKTGLGAIEMGVIMRNLMLRLGYEKFYIQGGDWGSLIGSSMATLFPENVIGYHSNMCATMAPLSTMKSIIVDLYPSLFIDEKYVDWIHPLSNKLKTVMEEMGYMHIQATKPETIGIALTDSPVGLLAYILEKFSTWTNINNRKLADGGLKKYYKMDALLDNVMIYYMTNSITTSMRLYAESFNERHLGYQLDRVPTNVPTACARFKNEIMHQVDWQIKDKFTNIIQTTYYEDGGHFAAFQFPDIMYKDIIKFVEKNEKM